jgi:hypothetical protein
VPSAPTTDPWGWIAWGREIAHLRLDTVAGPPSWKPLPALFTTPLSLLGGAAPAAWLVVARAGGLLALVFAYRLGTRLAGRAAGAIAALALLLSAQWLRQFAHGYSEGLAVALALWAIESHLDGRRGRALVLGSLVALSRPEAWPFVLAYGVLERPRAWPLPVAAPPLLWILPDWWGSGDPFHASTVGGRARLGSATAARAHREDPRVQPRGGAPPARRRGRVRALGRGAPGRSELGARASPGPRTRARGHLARAQPSCSARPRMMPSGPRMKQRR